MHISTRGSNIDQSGISHYSKIFYELLSRYYRENNDNFMSFSHGNPINQCDFSLKNIFDELDDNLDFIKQYPAYPPLIPGLNKVLIEYFKTQGFLFNNIDATIGHGVISLTQACFTVLCDPGETILVVEPFYGLFEWVAKLTSNKLIGLTGVKDNEYKICPIQLDNYLTKNTHIKTFLFVNPHNPTGHVYTYEEIQDICNVLIRHPRVSIIANEIYCHLTYNKDNFTAIGTMSGMESRTITLRGFSKDAGLAKERIGMVISNKEIIERINLFYMASSNGVSFTGQKIIEYLLKSNYENKLIPINKMYQKNLKKVLEEIKEINKVLCTIINVDKDLISLINIPVTGFFICLDFSKYCHMAGLKTDFEFMQKLLETTGISLAPGCISGWQPENCILRLTYSQKWETICSGMQIIKEFLLFPLEHKHQSYN